MRVDQSSMDISTLVEKIKRKEIDLQPEFQRGQVWSEQKKRRLIDTILRQWYVPAVHIVVNDELDKEEILDGQQRLQAIISFMSDEFPIDGYIEPEDDSILSLNGYYYSQLPDRVKSRFRRFPITTVRLRDYLPEEPGELFFRLNQLTALTAAEQRNALVGTPRNQIKILVKEFENSLSGSQIGFSNVRMNFDDSISRLAVSLELGTLQEKITASSLEKRYRSGEAFSSRIISSISGALTEISALVKNNSIYTKLNKASLFSWAYFIVFYDILKAEQGRDYLRDFFISFEAFRASSRHVSDIYIDTITSLNERGVRGALEDTVVIFNDRSSSRVNDVSSVLLRDMCLAASFSIIIPESVSVFGKLAERRSIIQASVERLAALPKDVAERALAESMLSRQWEAYHAAG